MSSPSLSFRSFMKSTSTKHRLLKELRSLFKTAEIAFAQIDFSGKGYITEEDLLNTLQNYKVPFTNEQIINFLKENYIFSNNSEGKMSLQIFKKIFFPSIVKESDLISNNEELLSKVDQNKIEGFSHENSAKLEEYIKDKISNNWKEARKAFL